MIKSLYLEYNNDLYKLPMFFRGHNNKQVITIYPKLLSLIDVKLHYICIIWINVLNLLLNRTKNREHVLSLFIQKTQIRRKNIFYSFRNHKKKFIFLYYPKLLSFEDVNRVKERTIILGILSRHFYQNSLLVLNSYLLLINDFQVSV